MCSLAQVYPHRYHLDMEAFRSTSFQRQETGRHIYTIYGSKMVLHKSVSSARTVDELIHGEA